MVRTFDSADLPLLKEVRQDVVGVVVQDQVEVVQ